MPPTNEVSHGRDVQREGRDAREADGRHDAVRVAVAGCGGLREEVGEILAEK